jgi:hypothetical protein
MLEWCLVAIQRLLLTHDGGNNDNLIVVIGYVKARQERSRLNTVDYGPP